MTWVREASASAPRSTEDKWVERLVAQGKAKGTVETYVSILRLYLNTVRGILFDLFGACSEKGFKLHGRQVS